MGSHARFRQVDRYLTGLGARATRIADSRSWWLGRSGRTAVTATHEQLLRAARRLGWTAVEPDLVRRMQRADPPGVPSFPVLTRSHPPGPAESSAAVVAVICADADGQPVPIDRVSWQREPFPDRPSTSRFSFHCLQWVPALLDAQAGRADDHCRRTAMRLAARWMAECLHAERFEKVWDDHITALRALALARLWTDCRSAEPDGSPFMQDLAAALVRHADKLLPQAIYRPTHNHGVTQAYALMAIGLILRGHPDAEGWVWRGRDRLEGQMAANVSVEGVHREHSPYYHFYVFKQFQEALRLGEAAGVAFSDRFRRRLRQMLSAGAHMLKPAGNLPAMGDTSRASPVLLEKDDLRQWPDEATAEYLYSATGGAGGAPPPETAVLYPEGGYAFLRSGWGAQEPMRDERFVAIRTGTFPTAHLHRDLLSFELYAYGSDLIVDSGGPFAYGHPLRDRYFVRSSAHNVLMVDGQDLPPGRARIVTWSPKAGREVLVAEHKPAPGVTHRRGLLMIRDRYWVLVDWLAAREMHTYEALFHLDPDLEPTATGRSVITAHAAAGATVKILPVREEGLQLQIRRAQESPPQGWVCAGEYGRLPSSALVYRAVGADVVLASVIVPDPPGRSSTVVLHGAERLGVLEVYLTLDGRRDHLTISPGGDARVASG